MNITDVRVRKITAEGKMKAIVSITIDDVFVVHDIKVIEGQDKLFIAMPSKGCSSPCPAKRQQMENIEILRILLTPKQEKICRT